MSITSVLIILGCLVAGYWIVSSIMEPGMDNDEAPRPEERKVPPRKVGPRDLVPRHPAPRTSARPTLPAAGRPAAPRRVANAPMADWYIVLDVPADASRSEIQAAAKRHLAAAEAGGDTLGAARIARAAEAGLKLRR